MVQRRFRSARFARVQRKIPGGETVTKFRERRPKQAHCAGCGNVLHGIPRMFVVDAKRASKTEKRPERPYGGVLCSACLRVKLISEHRK
jgi:large subunit ribosomal protein L34e